MYKKLAGLEQAVVEKARPYLDLYSTPIRAGFSTGMLFYIPDLEVLPRQFGINLVYIAAPKPQKVVLQRTENSPQYPAIKSYMLPLNPDKKERMETEPRSMLSLKYCKFSEGSRTPKA
jgi:hypothetical protein